MVKKFCDACGVEIGPEDQLPWTDRVDGRFRVLVNAAVKTNDPRAIGDWKEADLCIVCVRHVLDAYIQNRRLEAQRKKEKEGGQ